MVQNSEESGQQDILGAFWGESVPFAVQERDAYQTTQVVSICLNDMKPSDELDLQLRVTPLYTYLTTLLRRLKLLVSEEIWVREKVYRFALKLLADPENAERIKLGILMLGTCEEERVIDPFQKLGKIPSYTLYVLEASRNFSHAQAFVWELAKGLNGYAKMATLHVLQPLTLPMKEWMLFYGSQNSILPNMAAIICLEKADMADYLLNLPMDAHYFAALSRVFAYAFEKSNVKDFTVSLPLVTKYISAAPKIARTFLDFSAVLAISGSMSPYWEMDMKDVPKQNGWSSNLEQTVRGKCYNIIHQRKWESILRDEMQTPTCQSGQILAGIHELQLTPPFSDFLPMLWLHPFDFEVICYLTAAGFQEYTKDTVQYTKDNLPESVFSGALDLKEADLNAEYEPDMSLCFVLKAMYREDLFDEPFFLRCLSCRLSDCRKETIRCLRKFRSQWSPAVLSALETACEREPTTNIHKSLLRLLGKKDAQPSKEQRYVELPDDPVLPDEEDSFLFESRVAGAFYRDLLAVEGVLEEGDLLYLVREPDNQYDANAILVTTDDGYVLGYIPKQENSLPAAMLDSERKLYAILTDIHLTRSRLGIAVFLSEAAFVDDSGRPFLKVIKGGLESPS